MEYQTSAWWIAGFGVPKSAVHAYEKFLLKQKRQQAPEGSCNRVPRKETEETVSRRKYASMLLAVSPCLHMATVQPMCATESIV